MALPKVSVVREMPAPPPIVAVVLRMSEDQALALAVVLGRQPVGAHTTGLYHALSGAGFGYTHPRATELRDTVPHEC